MRPIQMRDVQDLPAAMMDVRYDNKYERSVGRPPVAYHSRGGQYSRKEKSESQGDSLEELIKSTSGEKRRCLNCPMQTGISVRHATRKVTAFYGALNSNKNNGGKNADQSK
jgi:hypothetical protein